MPGGRPRKRAHSSAFPPFARDELARDGDELAKCGRDKCSPPLHPARKSETRLNPPLPPHGAPAPRLGCHSSGRRLKNGWTRKSRRWVETATALLTPADLIEGSPRLIDANRDKLRTGELWHRHRSCNYDRVQSAANITSALNSVTTLMAAVPKHTFSNGNIARRSQSVRLRLHRTRHQSRNSLGTN
jgi:hypothetical protein